MITQVNIEKLPSYELGYERGYKSGYKLGYELGYALILEKSMGQGNGQGVNKIISQLLVTQSPEQVAKLTNLPLDRIVQVKPQNG